MHSLEVECLPKDLPEIIRIDVSALNVGEAIHVATSSFPKASPPGPMAISPSSASPRRRSKSSPPPIAGSPSRKSSRRRRKKRRRPQEVTLPPRSRSLGEGSSAPRAMQCRSTLMPDAPAVSPHRRPRQSGPRVCGHAPQRRLHAPRSPRARRRPRRLPHRKGWQADVARAGASSLQAADLHEPQRPAVRRVADFYKIEPAGVLIVLDDTGAPARQAAAPPGWIAPAATTACSRSSSTSAPSRRRGCASASAVSRGRRRGHVLGRFALEEREPLEQSLDRAVEAIDSPRPAASKPR